MEPSPIILIADDELIGELYQIYLEGSKYFVLLYCNGKEAYDAIQDGLQYHLGVFDLSLPDIGGDELVKLSKELHPTVPVICMSNYDLIDNAGGKEADRRLIKANTEMRVLETVIAELLGIK